MSNSEELNFKTPQIQAKPDEVIVPLHAEEISISKERLESGRVQVSTVTRDHEQLVDEFSEFVGFARFLHVHSSVRVSFRYVQQKIMRVELSANSSMAL